jgi:hypothetical protein
MRARECSLPLVAALRPITDGPQAADRTPRGGTPALALIVATLVLCAVVASAWTLRADYASGAAAVVLGKTEKTPKPSCPTPRKDGKPKTNAPLYKHCQAVGEVTGLQIRADGVEDPYRVPKPGKIVAWSVSLSKPHKSEIAFFSDAPESGPSVTAGVGWGKPSARIAVLKKRKSGRYRLTKQGPKVGLTAHLGRTPIFTLSKPLRVKAGTYIAITTSNWIPALAHDPPAATAKKDAWIASRGKKHCGKFPPLASDAEKVRIQQDMIEHSRPQQKVGSVRSYKCNYSAARLLYNAYLAPDTPKKK